MTVNGDGVVVNGGDMVVNSGDGGVGWFGGAATNGGEGRPNS